jgi:hypothetical protein
VRWVDTYRYFYLIFGCFTAIKNKLLLKHFVSGSYRIICQPKRNKQEIINRRDCYHKKYRRGLKAAQGKHLGYIGKKLTIVNSLMCGYGRIKSLKRGF